MTAKPVADDDTIVGYEIVDGALRPLNAEQFRASLQVGIDELDRGEGIDEEEMDRFFEAMIARLPPE